MYLCPQTVKMFKKLHNKKRKKIYSPVYVKGFAHVSLHIQMGFSSFLAIGVTYAARF